MREQTDAPGFLGLKAHQDNPFFRPGPDLAGAFPDTPTALAIVDKRGVVSFCSPTMGKLFDCREEQLEDCELASLLPGLPFKKKTPGQNLAFVDVWEQEGIWRKTQCTTPSGEHLLLDVSLRSISMANDQFILLGVRPARDGTAWAGKMVTER